MDASATNPKKRVKSSQVTSLATTSAKGSGTSRARTTGATNATGRRARRSDSQDDDSASEAETWQRGKKSAPSTAERRQSRRNAVERKNYEQGHTSDEDEAMLDGVTKWTYYDEDGNQREPLSDEEEVRTTKAPSAKGKQATRDKIPTPTTKGKQATRHENPTPTTKRIRGILEDSTESELSDVQASDDNDDGGKGKRQKNDSSPLVIRRGARINGASASKKATPMVGKLANTRKAGNGTPKARATPTKASTTRAKSTRTKKTDTNHSIYDMDMSE